MIYGKHHRRMYTGSMVGKGGIVFAVMGYVIANMELDPEVGAQVELNAELLGHVFGEPEPVVQKAIDFLCQPDPKSRSKDEDGRRLVRVGEYAYRVVNGLKYFKIRNAVESRESERIRKAEYRARIKAVKRGTPSPGEPEYVSAVGEGGEAAGNAVLERLEKLSPNRVEERVVPPLVPLAIDPAGNIGVAPAVIELAKSIGAIPAQTGVIGNTVTTKSVVVLPPDGLPDNIPGLEMLRREKETTMNQLHKAFCEVVDGKESWLSVGEHARWKRARAAVREILGKIDRLKGGA